MCLARPRVLLPPIRCEDHDFQLAVYQLLDGAFYAGWSGVDLAGATASPIPIPSDESKDN